MRRVPKSSAPSTRRWSRGYDVWPLMAANDMQAAMLRLHTKSGDTPRPGAASKP